MVGGIEVTPTSTDKEKSMAYFSVFKRKNDNWLVCRVEWDAASKKEKKTALTREEKLLLGFSEEFSLELARERAKQLNAVTKVDRGEAAARRVTKDRLVKSAYMPDEIANEFEKKLLTDSFASPKAESKLKSRWKATKKLIIQLRISPESAYQKETEIHKWLVAQKFSPDYSYRIIGILNRYCQHVCSNHKLYFEPVKVPSGVAKEKLMEAYEDKDSYFGPAGPLTPGMLEAGRGSLPKGNYEWLFVSVWFGLRPEEVDNLIKKPQFHRLEQQEKGVILWVYQTKLVGIPRKDRWKPIPLIYEEQRIAMAYITESAIKRPILKTLARVFKERVRLYSGRKGFTDLMLSKGRALEDISQWMGHLTIDRTWRSYKNRKIVNF